MTRTAMLIILPLTLATSVTTGATVRLHRSAEVAGPSVRLGDVASLSDCPEGLKSMLRDVVVAESPGGRMTVHVRLSDVRRRLVEKGVNMTEIVLEGSSEIEVRRRATERPTGRGGTLSENVRREVLREASRALGRPAEELELGTLGFEAFGIPENARVTLTPVGEVTFPGTVTFEAVATMDETETGRFEVKAELAGVRRVVVASRTLGAGTTIREQDVETARVDGTLAAPDAFHKTDLVVGERLAKPVSAGGAITPESLAKPVLVSRGDVCRMTIRGRGFHILGEARARENGSVGEIIAMESLKERRRFSATVTARREVEVQLAKEEN